MRLGVKREKKTHIRSPRASDAMNHSGNVRIFRKVVKAHLTLFEKWVSLESKRLFSRSLLRKRRERGEID